MPNTPYFSRYESPNIVIVPTVSFPAQTTKTAKFSDKNQAKKPLKNDTSETLLVPKEIDKSVMNLHVETSEKQSGTHLEKKTMAIQENKQSSPTKTGLHTENQAIQSFYPAVSNLRPSAQQTQFSEDVEVNFSTVDREIMAKKTLTWASNYLKSIGQSHPKPSKYHQRTTHIQNKFIEKENGITYKAGTSTDALSHQNQNTSSQKNTNVLYPNQKSISEKNKNIKTVEVQPVNLKTSKLQESNNSKAIKLNLMNDKKVSAKECDKDNTRKSCKNIVTFKSKHNINLKNDISKLKPENTKKRTSSSQISIKSHKLHDNKKHAEKNKKQLSNMDKTLSQPKPINIPTDKHKKQIGEINYIKHLSTENKTKSKIQDKIMKKRHMVDKASNTFKLDYKHKVKDTQKSKSPKKFNKIKDEKKQNIDKAKLTKKSGESKIKDVEKKNSTPIKSMVQVTGNFDLNATSTSMHNNEDLRNKLKRKHSNFQDEKRDNLVITVQNETENEGKGNMCAGTKQKNKNTQLKQETRKYKKIKLVINLQFENCSESSESDSDNNNNQLHANVDLSFLDDFNVDDIVECLSPEAKHKGNLNVCEPFKPKLEINTGIQSVASCNTFADAHNNNKALQLGINSGDIRNKQQSNLCEGKIKLEQNITNQNMSVDNAVYQEGSGDIKKCGNCPNDQHKSDTIETNILNNLTIQERLTDQSESLQFSKTSETDINVSGNKTEFKKLQPKLEVYINKNVETSSTVQDITEIKTKSPDIKNPEENVHHTGISLLELPEGKGEIITLSDSEDDASSGKVIDKTNINNTLIKIKELTKDSGNAGTDMPLVLDAENSVQLHNKLDYVDSNPAKPIDSPPCISSAAIIEDNIDNRPKTQVRTTIEEKGIAKVSEEHLQPIIKEEIITVNNNKIAINGKDVKPDTKESMPSKVESENKSNKINGTESKANSNKRMCAENNTTNKKSELVIHESKGNPPVKNHELSVPNFDLPVDKALLSGVYTRMSEYFGFQYNITSLIRNGKFSRVFQCMDPKGGTYALKVTHPNKIKFVMDWRKEEILKSIQKDIPKKNFHCIFLIDGFMAKGQWCFLMEYYPNNLQIALADYGKCFHIDLVQKLSRQLVSAILVLRNNNIAHLGIKPEHILLNSSNDQLKLAGFDEAQPLEGIRVLPNLGTVSYRPPEVILGYPCFLKVDVWAGALILYEMATNIKLFPGCYNNDILFKQQCTFGNIPFDMLEDSEFRKIHYSGTFFLRSIDRQKKVIIREFNKSNRLTSTIMSAYSKTWGKSRTKKESFADKQKLFLLRNLLDDMLALHPRERLPIEFAYTHQFIYESFDSSDWR